MFQAMLGGHMSKCMNYVAELVGAMGIVMDVAAVPENISSLAPFNSYGIWLIDTM